MMEKIKSILVFVCGTMIYFWLGKTIVNFLPGTISDANAGGLVVVIIYIVFILPLLLAFVRPIEK